MDEHTVVGIVGCLSIFVLTGGIVWCIHHSVL
jgi:hypothetical protein